jgi:hypothetical protein
MENFEHTELKKLYDGSPWVLLFDMKSYYNFPIMFHLFSPFFFYYSEMFLKKPMLLYHFILDTSVCIYNQ